jgi:hypothetical protein
LFGFFTSAASALECFFYATYFVGKALIDPLSIGSDESLKDFYRSKTWNFFKEHFQDDPFTSSLNQLLNHSKEYEQLREIRNTLSHRLTPSRTVFPFSTRPHEWNLRQWAAGKENPSLHKNFLLKWQSWLEHTVGTIHTELEAFWAQAAPPGNV